LLTSRPTRAALVLQVWNSDTSEDARKAILSELVSDEPELRLLYTTPESLRNPSLRNYLKV
jgi:superfamily II DNA helicase RecQ